MWAEELLDIGGGAGRRASRAHRSDHGEARQGRSASSICRRVPCDELAAALRPALKRGHIGLGPGLVAEDQLVRIKSRLILPPLRSPSGDRRAVLLGGEQRFFGAEPGAAQLMPHRIVADSKAPRAQFLGQRPDRQMRAGFQLRQKPRFLIGKNTGGHLPSAWPTRCLMRAAAGPTSRHSIIFSFKPKASCGTDGNHRSARF